MIAFPLDTPFIVLADGLECLRIQIRVGLHAHTVLGFPEDDIEIGIIDAQRDLAEELDQSSVRVEGESSVLCRLGQSLDNIVIEAKIEDGIHHARHGDGRT